MMVPVSHAYMLPTYPTDMYTYLTCLRLTDLRWLVGWQLSMYGSNENNDY